MRSRLPRSPRMPRHRQGARPADRRGASPPAASRQSTRHRLLRLDALTRRSARSGLARRRGGRRERQALDRPRHRARRARRVRPVRRSRLPPLRPRLAAAARHHRAASTSSSCIRGVWDKALVGIAILVLLGLSPFAFGGNPFIDDTWDAVQYGGFWTSSPWVYAIRFLWTIALIGAITALVIWLVRRNRTSDRAGASTSPEAAFAQYEAEAASGTTTVASASTAPNPTETPSVTDAAPRADEPLAPAATCRRGSRHRRIRGLEGAARGLAPRPRGVAAVAGRRRPGSQRRSWQPTTRPAPRPSRRRPTRRGACASSPVHAPASPTSSRPSAPASWPGPLAAIVALGGANSAYAVTIGLAVGRTRLERSR